MVKFQLLIEVLRSEGLADQNTETRPTPATRQQLSLAHDRSYVDAVMDATLEPKIAREIGFPICPTIGRRAAAACGGTLLAARLALKYGLAANTAGGSHHARFEQGAGFCTFNDVAVAAKVLLEEDRVENILVIDLDVHQGDGTALIFAQDPRVFTFSLHCRENYPVRKAQSDWDEEITEGTGDGPYLERVQRVLDKLLPMRRWDLVFYNAGVDPHQRDGLGKLNLTDQGLTQRDHLVISSCRALDLPVAGVIGGGYGKDLLEIAHRHATLHRTMAAISNGSRKPQEGFAA